MSDEVLRIAFISDEDEPPDLGVSFAIDLGGSEIASLMLNRTPTYERLLPENEHGVTVSYDVEDNPPMLTACRIDYERAEIVTTRKTYRLDLHRVDADDLKAAFAVLRKMNFDNCALLELPE